MQLSNLHEYYQFKTISEIALFIACSPQAIKLTISYTFYQPNDIKLADMLRAFNNFWNPTPELRAAMQLPAFGGRFSAAWKASWRWPVIWRRLVVIFVVMQLWNVGYLAVRGFQTVALERQAQTQTKWERAVQAKAKADLAFANYYCSIGTDPRTVGLKYRCR